MGFRGQSGPRKGSGEKLQKTQHEKKAKTKAQKNKAGKYVEETPVPSTEEIAEKTFSSLNRLGTQTFAVSPFSQYFDDWLVNLREVVAEFEATPSVKPDETFVKERTQILTDVERELAETRIKENALEEAARNLATQNHRLVELDEEYAVQTRELSAKRNKENEPLTKKVHDLEQELDRVKQMKTSFFGFTKKAKAKKEAEVTQKLDTAKKELELAIQNFTVEQEKLHDDYQKKKQDTMENVQRLEKEIVDIETDASIQARKAACTALSEAVKALLKRPPVTAPAEPQSPSSA